MSIIECGLNSKILLSHHLENLSSPRKMSDSQSPHQYLLLASMVLYLCTGISVASVGIISACVTSSCIDLASFWNTYKILVHVGTQYQLYLLFKTVCFSACHFSFSLLKYCFNSKIIAAKNKLEQVFLSSVRCETKFSLTL